MQAKSQARLDNQNRINQQLKTSRTFHRTPGVLDREPTKEAQRALEKLEPFDLPTRVQD
jgi:hypothetical protein